MQETVHLHPNRLNRDINIFLLFIPAVVFVLLIFLLFSGFRKNEVQVATTQEPSILGEEVER